jgi:hypothetical protein
MSTPKTDGRLQGREPYLRAANTGGARSVLQLGTRMFLKTEGVVITPAKIAANIQNAKKSTGPRSDAIERQVTDPRQKSISSASTKKWGRYREFESKPASV